MKVSTNDPTKTNMSKGNYPTTVAQIHDNVDAGYNDTESYHSEEWAMKII